MNTIIYMVRHGDSPKTDGNDRTRGLSEKGTSDANRVTEMLKEEDIDVCISSPYKRSILTIKPLADWLEQEVIVVEDLKERIFSPEKGRLPDTVLFPLLNQSFSDPNFALDGGESNLDCQNRSVKVLKEVLETHQGKKVVIGTHGAVMALMMGYFDPQYQLDFLLQTTKPDIYRMEFHNQELVGVKRIWN